MCNYNKNSRASEKFYAQAIRESMKLKKYMYSMQRDIQSFKYDVYRIPFLLLLAAFFHSKMRKIIIKKQNSVKTFLTFHSSCA